LILIVPVVVVISYVGSRLGANGFIFALSTGIVAAITIQVLFGDRDVG
jgi:hypothetical protein